MGRIGRLFSIWKTNWAENPAARGAAKMAAGVALILEGWLGMRARLRGNSGGLVAAFFLIVFGAVFFGVGYLAKPDAYKDEVVVEGTVVSSESHMSKDSDGRNQRMHRAVYGFQVNGKEYSFPSSISTSSAPTTGKTVTLAYSASNPNNARRLDGVDGSFHKIFQGIGLLVALMGLYQLMICSLLIGAGLALFYTGRKDRAISGASEGFLKDLFSLVHSERTNREALFGGVSGGGSIEPASPSMPPAGWMVDPESNRQMRWWDGAAWTDMRKPVDSAGPVEPEQSDTQGW